MNDLSRVWEGDSHINSHSLVRNQHRSSFCLLFSAPTVLHVDHPVIKQIRRTAGAVQEKNTCVCSKKQTRAGNPTRSAQALQFLFRFSASSLQEPVLFPFPSLSLFGEVDRPRHKRAEPFGPNTHPNVPYLSTRTTTTTAVGLQLRSEQLSELGFSLLQEGVFPLLALLGEIEEPRRVPG